MTYQFARFFAKPAVVQPVMLPSDAVWKGIVTPFQGVGIRLPARLGTTPDVIELLEMSHQLGLAAVDWLYLTYDCWAGSIDMIYGFVSHAGQIFGPVKDTDLASVTATYIKVMNDFGVSVQDALHFSPFVRGFWGEV